ncbi:MAG: hypothetical protein J5699_07635 [Bacteroidales bacterium]|nr:hypothetical protein [Bacteroidales bacterium]
MTHKHLTIISLVAVIFLAAGCTSAPKKLDRFVEKTEINCDNYETEDWDKSMQQYKKLVDEYKNSDKEYTDEEKKMALKAMGRYHALLIKKGLEKSATFIEEFGAALPSYLDGILDGMKENTEGFGKSLEEMFDGEKIDKALSDFSDKLEEIFSGKEEK